MKFGGKSRVVGGTRKQEGTRAPLGASGVDGRGAGMRC